MKIHKVSIRNFKSIRELDFELNDINVLIGANGAGKSNFISFFKFLNQIVEGNLQTYVVQKGGADNFLYFGKKHASSIKLSIILQPKNLFFNHFALTLIPSQNDEFLLENLCFELESATESFTDKCMKFGEDENESAKSFVTKNFVHYLDIFKIYHFHDTSDTAYVKGFSDLNDNRALREDASNLPAFLYYLQEKQPDSFHQIEKTVTRIAPFFDRFVLQPSLLMTDKIRLEWREKGSDKYFNAHHLSDGTLRMICLATLLLQPEPPAVIIIDEPELGLHPSAINILSGLIQSASKRAQILISTQSVTFINNFLPEDIIVVERRNEQSEFERLEAADLQDWLEEYGIGEIWEKNIIGGRP